MSNPFSVMPVNKRFVKECVELEEKIKKLKEDLNKTLTGDDPEALKKCLEFWKDKAKYLSEKLATYQELITRRDVSRWLAKNADPEAGMYWMSGVKDKLPYAGVPGDVRHRESDDTTWMYRGEWEMVAKGRQ